MSAIPTLPGRSLHRIATRWCSTASRERIIEPLIADFQREWLSERTPGRRSIVRVRGCLAFWIAFAWCGARSAIDVAEWQRSGAASRLLRGAGFLSVPAAGILAEVWVRSGQLTPAKSLAESAIVPNLVIPLLMLWGRHRDHFPLMHRRTAGAATLLTAAILLIGHFVRTWGAWQLGAFTVTMMLFDEMVGRRLRARGRRATRQIPTRL